MGKKKKAKLKIPKQIAGVKVPKELREQAKVAVKLAESPMARELLAAGLTAAAAALVKVGKGGPSASAAAEADEAKEQGEGRKRDGFAGVATDIALCVAAAFAEEKRRKAGQNGDQQVMPETVAP